MQYVGQIYGRVGGKYVPLGESVDENSVVVDQSRVLKEGEVAVDKHRLDFTEDEIARLNGWLRKIVGAGPKVSAETLRQWAYEAVVLQRREGE
jgi:hypothetical protein